LKIGVEQVQQAYDTGGLVQDVASTGSPRTQPTQMDEKVATALMGVLDDSIMDLMNELDDEFRDELQKEKELEKNKSKNVRNTTKRYLIWVFNEKEDIARKRWKRMRKR